MLPRRHALLGLVATSVLLLGSKRAGAAAPARLQVTSVTVKPGPAARAPGELVEVTVRLKNLGPAARGHVMVWATLEAEWHQSGKQGFEAPHPVGKTKRFDLPAAGHEGIVDLAFPAPALPSQRNRGRQRVRVRWSGGPVAGSDAHAFFRVKRRP